MSQLSDEFQADALPEFYEVLGKACTYSRGEASAELTMLPPPPGMQIVNSDGVFIPTTGGEFLCRKADLVLGSVAATPAHGDVVTDDGGRIYDVRSWEELVETGQWLIFTEKVG